MRASRVVTVLLSAALLAVGVSACAPSAPPDSVPMLRGVIVSVEPAEEGGSIRVVWHESVGELRELDSCQVSVGADTEIFSADGAPLAFADLSVRDVVDVWIAGPIAESYPPQATADAIQVVGELEAGLPLPVLPGLVPPQ